jgi:O-antigen ligase
MPFYSQQYQSDPDVVIRQLAQQRRGHNLYLEIAAETGLLGLTIFISMPAVLLHRLWKARRRHALSRPQLSYLAAAFFFAITAYLGTGIFLHMAFERYYWCLLGLASAALHVIRDQEQAWIPQRDTQYVQSSIGFVRTGGTEWYRLR